jgi:hypothetical protein
VEEGDGLAMEQNVIDHKQTAEVVMVFKPREALGFTDVQVELFLGMRIQIFLAH